MGAAQLSISSKVLSDRRIWSANLGMAPLEPCKRAAMASNIIRYPSTSAAALVLRSPCSRKNASADAFRYSPLIDGRSSVFVRRRMSRMDGAIIAKDGVRAKTSSPGNPPLLFIDILSPLNLEFTFRADACQLGSPSHHQQSSPILQRRRTVPQGGGRSGAAGRRRPSASATGAAAPLPPCPARRRRRDLMLRRPHPAFGGRGGEDRRYTGGRR